MIDANGNGYNPNPDEEEKDKNGINFDSVGQMLKEWWQVIASGVSIVLIIIFVAKTISYLGRKKEAKRTAEEKYKSYYAAATGLFGLAFFLHNSFGLFGKFLHKLFILLNKLIDKLVIVRRLLGQHLLHTRQQCRHSPFRPKP